MSGPVRHRHDEMHRGLVPEDQLADGTPVGGDVPTATGYGYAIWAAPAGGAVDAADVTFTPTGNVAATDVQAAIAELDTEKEVAGTTATHIGDGSDAHDASAISIVDAGNFFTGTEVEAALQELAAAGGHAAVTLDSDADAFLSLTAQEIGLDVQNANKVFAGPTTGADNEPTFRALVDDDIPAAIARDSEVTSAVGAHTGNVTDAHDASAISFDATGLTQTSATEVQTAIEDLDAAIAALPGGHDPVTLATDADTILSLTAQELGLDTQTANTVLAGPTSGGAADPAFRALVAADVPALLVLPTVVNVGVSASGTGDVTPGLPTGHTTDDILLLFVQSNNQAIAAPATYSRLGPHAGFGTAGAAGATRLAIFWKRDGGAESDPTVLDTTDHTLAQIMAVRGCPTIGDPFLCVGSNRKLTASVAGTASAGATPVDACLVVAAFTHALDSASAVFSSPTNADLGSVTEQIDVATADGNGGGIGVFTGTKAKAGTFAATTVTETSTTDASLTFIMLPSGITGRAGFIDRQVFLTAGLSDTWTKPTAATMVYVAAVGGGGSGGAGRNAATAAGGGGGGGGGFDERWFAAGTLAATVTALPGAGGAATANVDGTTGNGGNNTTFGASVVFAPGTSTAAGATTGSGGVGGFGGGRGTAPAAGTFLEVFGSQFARGGTGGTTAAAGSANYDFSGGGGAGGGTSQAASAGGATRRGAAGGGGGRSNTNVGTGGASNQAAGGATAGANGTDSPYPEAGGGGGGAGGTSAAGPGGSGGWPGGGGGGGGSQAAAQRGGAGGDGVVVVVTYC